MFTWYRNAQLCYVYLADVTSALHKESPDALCRSKWFTRGWTLQELLAPNSVYFCSQEWCLLGTKFGLSDQISKVTGISMQYLLSPEAACVAVKFSWVSHRKTSRTEDMAYCLLGLLDVNLPLLYGEGSKAFLRLQFEIVRNSSDESIFAWSDNGLDSGSIFARSPKAFAQCGNVVEASFPQHEKDPYNLCNRGLAMQVPHFQHNADYFSSSVLCTQTVALQCAYAGAERDPICITLVRKSKRQWARRGNLCGEGKASLWQKGSTMTLYIDTLPSHSQHKALSPFLSSDTANLKSTLSIHRTIATSSSDNPILSLAERTLSGGDIDVLDHQIRVRWNGQWFFCGLRLQCPGSGRQEHDEEFALFFMAHENDATIRFCSVSSEIWTYHSAQELWTKQRGCCFREDSGGSWNGVTKIFDWGNFTWSMKRAEGYRVVDYQVSVRRAPQPILGDTK